jgi:hypothetical protein
MACRISGFIEIISRRHRNAFTALSADPIPKIIRVRITPIKRSGEGNGGREANGGGAGLINERM